MWLTEPHAADSGGWVWVAGIGGLVSTDGIVAAFAWRLALDSVTSRGHARRDSQRRQRQSPRSRHPTHTTYAAFVLPCEVPPEPGVARRFPPALTSVSLRPLHHPSVRPDDPCPSGKPSCSSS